MTLKTKLLTRSRKLQSQGRIGEALKVMILAGEIATIKEVEHG